MSGSVSVKRVVSASIVVGVGSVAACTLLGFAGAWWWRFDLLAHFRVQYLVLAVVGLAAALVTRQWRTAIAAGVALAINAMATGSLWIGSAAPAAAGTEPPRGVTYNVNYANVRHADIADYLVAADADVIAVFEVTAELEPVLRERLADYEAIVDARPDAFGVALFARGDVDYVDAFGIDDHSGIPSAHAVVAVAGHRYAILALHTMPPVTADNAALRDRMMAGAARWANVQTATPVIVGDFNATPWSHAFRALVDDADLVSSQRGHGVQPTWGPWPLRVPIDHCLHGEAVTTVGRHVGPFLGSDHRPVHCDLAPAR